MTAKRKNPSDRGSPCIKAAALGVSLVLSALVTAVALQVPDHHWLAWISFLPLFVAVRWLGRPVHSGSGGRNRPRRPSVDLAF